MPGGLLEGVGQPDHRGFTIRSAEKRDPHRKVRRRESGRNGYGGGIDQECVQMRRALLIHIGGMNSVFDQSRCVLDTLVDNGIQLIVRHQLHDVDRQFFSSFQIFIVTGVIGHNR